MHRIAGRGHRSSRDHSRAAFGTARADNRGVDDASSLGGELRGAWEARSLHCSIHGYVWDDGGRAGRGRRGAVQARRSGYDGVVVVEDAYQSAGVAELGDVIDIGGGVVVYDVEVKGGEDVDVDIGIDDVDAVCAVDGVDGVGDVVGNCWGVEDGVDDGGVEGSECGGDGCESHESESGLHDCWEQEKRAMNGTSAGASVRTSLRVENVDGG